MNIHDVQTKLVTDLRIHLDQHRQLVEALQSIEKVYDGMASLKEQLTEKVQVRIQFLIKNMLWMGLFVLTLVIMLIILNVC